MALTEEQLNLLGERLVPIYQKLEQEVIADIARRVKKTGRYTETAEIMVKSLMEQGYSPAKIQKEVMKLIRADKAYQTTVAENTKSYKDMVTDEIKKTVEEAKKQGNAIVSEAGMMAYNNDLSMWEQAGKKLSRPNEFTQLIHAMALQTNNELKNITGTLGFKGIGFTALENVYQYQLDLGLIKLTSGAYSWQQVVDDCVRGLAQSGLRTIDYKSGRSMQLDTAVRNCILTASSQLAGKVTMLNMEETGETLVEVSSHWGARSDGSCGHADHAYWQGKVYALDKGGHRKESRRLGYVIQNLEEATGYPSDPKGLHGYNCRHTMYPFFEGISEPNKWDPEPKPVKVNGKEYDYYHATQKQRQMERNIRATKREIEGQKAIGGDTTVLNARLKKQLADYKQFSADVNVRPKNERLRVQNGTSKSVVSDKGTGYTKPKGIDLSNWRRKIINTDSEQDALLSNANYKRDMSYKTNCQRCVPAYEMRRRGYDVTAKPSKKDGGDPINEETWMNIFLNAKWKSCGAGNGLAEIEFAMKQYGDGARAEIYVVWENGKDAHVFVAEQKNGKTVFIDPQDGTNDARDYFEYVLDGHTEMCRIDNLEVSELIKECCEDYKKYD